MTELERRANEMRSDIVRMIAEAGSGHPGGSLSCADILAALYFGGVLDHDPERPDWEERDRFILAKGHAAPALYAVLAQAGYFPREELLTLRKLGTRLQGHPDSNLVPGVEVSTGSLGQGLSVAAGIAAGLKLDGKTQSVFALLGDDGAGESHPVSDAPRWWWTQRRFHAGSVCSGQYDDKYVNYAYTCTSDGKWEGSDTDAIQSQPFWTTKETSFPIPEGGGPSSTTDPQQTVSQAYNTVLLPMDDGNWHVTVYCPAALDASLLDKDANELDPDQVKAGDEAYTVISATGYGTVQHPCRTVEVVVGGQKPFWSLRNTQ